MEQELQRKDAILQKHHDKVQLLIGKMSGGITPLGGASAQPQQTPPGHPSGAQPPQASPQGGVGAPPQGMGTQGQMQGGVGAPGGAGLNQGPLAYLEQTTSNIGQSRGST